MSLVIVTVIQLLFFGTNIIELNCHFSNYTLKSKFNALMTKIFFGKHIPLPFQSVDCFHQCYEFYLKSYHLFTGIIITSNYFNIFLLDLQWYQKKGFFTFDILDKNYALVTTTFVCYVINNIWFRDDRIYMQRSCPCKMQRGGK